MNDQEFRLLVIEVLSEWVNIRMKLYTDKQYGKKEISELLKIATETQPKKET